MDSTEENVGHLVARAADALVEQAGLQLELAKAELFRDVKGAGKVAAPFAVGVPLVCMGYTFFCLGTGLVVGQLTWLGNGGGFLVVGAFNLLIGGIALRRGISHVR